ncbi:unnamed protein product (macronuclear) [Paramecium tetraurelia]|uniref:Uncharacterized protein n=1 Tax=Paramecium tetraurelia TaxID=5888 RepID=A0DH85_PARTE|nr:uncharacterized protein GSPATT00016788001 [Paramecium tetraurelia]CAK82402.1 unnamed protein product [Paramecium tetraurelia]|eukprot:XP_001449799.1 hypothetical protein (macronuclear) [Paramecium tetraurelia strain d4-2]
MNLRLKNSNYMVGNNDLTRLRRARLIQPSQPESKSLATVKMNLSPELKPKKQKTIHHDSVQDENILNQKQMEKSKIYQAKLQELLSLRKSSLTPLLKQQINRQQTIIKHQPDFLKDQDLYGRIRRQSIENLQTQEKSKNFVLKSSQECTQKKRIQNSQKSANYINGAPILNRSVSQFTCLTPKKKENNSFSLQQKECIKRQKFESLINLFININIENIVIAFNSIKSKAPMLPFIKELERRKEDFQQKRFFIQLVKAQ